MGIAAGDAEVGPAGRVLDELRRDGEDGLEVVDERIAGDAAEDADGRLAAARAGEAAEVVRPALQREVPGAGPLD